MRALERGGPRSGERGYDEEPEDLHLKILHSVAFQGKAAFAPLSRITSHRNQVRRAGSQQAANVERLRAARQFRDYVARISELARPALLRELLLLELDYRRRRGETPDPVEYRARFPDCLADIEAAFAPVPRREQPVPATVAVAELGPVASRCSPPDRIGLRPARRSPPAPCRWQPGLATTRRRPPRAPPLPTGPVPVAARFGNHSPRP
jgi:hypothetical protein